MDSEDETRADDAPQTDGTAAGAQLRAARKEKRLELSQIAAETRIPLRHLEAIEAGNFESLPSRAYALGFSRTFARAVGLDDAQITEAVRAELADGSMRRNVSSEGMEPGDPAKLPSAGLAWAGAIAALVLAVGAIAFFNAYFGAGTGLGSLISPAPETPPTASASAGSGSPSETVPAEAAASGGAVVLTATADGIWLRLTEAGGERLLERTLQQGEQVTVPAAAADPRINTGRPDALAITIGGKSVAPLSDRAVTLADAPVSAAALLARAAPAPAPVAAAAPSAPASTSPRPAALRPANAATRSGTGAGAQTGAAQRATTAASDRAAPAPVTSAPAPAPAPQPAASVPAAPPVSTPAGDDPAT